MKVTGRCDTWPRSYSHIKLSGRKKEGERERERERKKATFNVICNILWPHVGLMCICVCLCICDCVLVWYRISMLDWQSNYIKINSTTHTHTYTYRPRHTRWMTPTPFSSSFLLCASRLKLGCIHPSMNLISTSSCIQFYSMFNTQAYERYRNSLTIYFHSKITTMEECRHDGCKCMRFATCNLHCTAYTHPFPYMWQH